MRTFKLFHVMYETPGGTPGGGAPTPQAGQQPQPGAPGQGQPATGQGDGFRQTYFPNVPDEQWNVIEPHVKGINQHVTQTEQRFAPLKNYTPEAVQGLATFAEAFDRDPVGAWVGTARMLQQRGILDRDLDLEHLEAIVSGQDPDFEPEPNGNGNGVQGLEGLPPEVAQLIQGLQAEVDELEGGFKKQRQTAQQRQEDAALNRQLGWMRNQLKEGGVPENLLSDERLMGEFITHRGNAQAAVKAALDYRSAILGTLAGGQPEPGKKDLELPNGTPKTRQPSSKGKQRSNRSSFGNAGVQAEQFLAGLE
jgi:hypothetical protein